MLESWPTSLLRRSKLQTGQELVSDQREALTQGRAITPPELLCDDACAAGDRLLCGVTTDAAALDDRRPRPAASISAARSGSVIASSGVRFVSGVGLSRDMVYAFAAPHPLGQKTTNGDGLL